MNIQMRKKHPIKYAGKEIFEITPIILGGDTESPSNKAFFYREEHIKAVNYWNAVIKGIESGSSHL